MTAMLEGKAAIVTGAGQGIGRGVARMFATEGAKVAVVDIDAARAAEVAESIVAEGREAIAVVCDVGVREQVQRAVRETVAAFGTVDLLVNTAIAGAPRVPLLETSEELMDVMFRTGPLATLMFTQECHPHMKGKDGAIVNFASGGAISGDLGYAASYTHTRDASGAGERG